MSEQRRDIVTIDGPSGVGKSTLSRKVAAALGYTYLDTGAMYRAVAYWFKKNERDWRDLDVVEKALPQLCIELLPAGSEGAETGVLLNGEDVSAFLRAPEISMLASSISALPAVRTALTDLQRGIGGRGAIVAEGRDTGTVVFPQAAHKFYLDATPQERAERRIKQLRARGETVDAGEVLALTLLRDKQDRERAIAPLRKAPDAVVLDTTRRSLEQVFAEIMTVIRSRR